MATRNPSTGMAHLTVVPENFEPAADDDGTRDDGDEGAGERVGGDGTATGDEDLTDGE
ncbi:hypothetical protein ACFQMA_06585 [Halosimplex aquaticum]|uniref:Uncharacterized protein n=1 Tax=Halosimplex aquaticum TaxID=3026162 RepID=A0ABD5Y0T7_9EURY|nr:hypothetical protein [Halosimplex aquaticum]